MGQRLSKTSWAASASSKDSRSINLPSISVEGKFQPTSLIEHHKSCCTNQNLELSKSQAIIYAESHDLHHLDNVGIYSENGDSKIPQSVSSSSSSSAPSPNQFVIRIQLTKMENNSNNTNNLDDSCSIQSNALRISSRPSSGAGDSSELFPSLDNNLNITCGTHSIINLSISNNIVCDEPINTNNLNLVNTVDSNSNNIHYLNLVENHQRGDEIENNLNITTSTKEGRCQIHNILPTMSNNNRSKIFGNGKISSRHGSNLTTIPGANAALSIRCIDGVICRCNLNSCANKAVDYNCDSGHTSMCSQSTFEGDRHHCCRPKKISSAYPSKLRCCQCACSESAIPSSSNSNDSLPGSDASNECINRNSIAAKPVCRSSSNILSTASVSNRQGHLDISPPSRQICRPPVRNLIVLSVNSNGQHIIVDPQQGDIQFLPVICPSATNAAGLSGVSGFGPVAGPMVHSQADYSHCLVPDLEKITNCSFYWGKMDRYEAERLLEGKPEGTFLLRDSAQEEYLFSVTFRKYGRSLHARIEQLGHKFSFDCHDPGVYTASTVTGLLEHYKDPSCVMFFEPMLTIPLHRNFSFSLQQLCRATIVSHISYDGINELQLPSSLKAHLKEYHYKYKVRETPLDESMYSCP